MIINKTGKIVDNLYKLGDEGVPVYLLDGDPPAIFDAGYSILGKLYVKEIQKILGSRHPAYCFISHSHFDHCGAVARFKKSFPSLQIVSSEKAKRIFCRPNAIKLIQKLSLSAEPYISKPGIDPLMYDSFETFEINQTVKDEDRLVLSPGITVRVIETPGHTRDCLSYYIPEKKVLFSSEAIGIADQSGYISSSFLVDYDMYFESMKKLSHLELEVICLGHGYVYTGEDARRYIPNAILSCENFFNLIKRCLVKENGDLNKVKSRIKKIEYDGKEMVQPEPAYLLNLEASIKAVKKKMRGK